MGSEKQRHASPAAALEWVLAYGLKFTGHARLYRCPTSTFWHVSTTRLIAPKCR